MRKEKIDGVVETVADKASDFRWAFDERGATLTAVKGKTLTRAVVPAEVDGVPVVALGDHAFCMRKTLKTVEAPDGLTEIGEGAFSLCRALETIVLPASLTAVRMDAFFGCKSLKSIVFRKSSSPTTLGLNAFFGCESLEKVALPDGLTKIPSEAFCGCKLLKTIVLPDGLTEIGESAFKNCASLETVAIPASVAKISASAFENCRPSLAFVAGEETSASRFAAKNRIPCVAELGPNGTAEVVLASADDFDWAFDERGATALGPKRGATRAVVPAEVDGVPVVALGDEAFKDCRALTSVAIPASVAKISASAFENCRPSLAFVAGEETSASRFAAKNRIPCVAELGPNGTAEVVLASADDFDWAFDERGATALGPKRGATRAVVPAEVDGVPVVALEDEAFKDCRALTSVEFPASLTALGNEAFKGCASLAAVEFPAGLTTFGNEAFKGCASLAAVEFPAGLTTLGSEAFFGCEALETVEFPANSALTTLGDKAFANCFALRTVALPDGLTEIGEGAFYFSGLETVSFPPSLATLGDGAFCFCKALKTLTFNAGLKAIGDSAFYWCSGLESVEFPDDSSLTRIGSLAFYWCRELKEIAFPASLTEIAEQAFFQCELLRTVEFPANSALTTVGDKAFGRTLRSLTFIAPDGSFAAEFATQKKYRRKSER